MTMYNSKYPKETSERNKVVREAAAKYPNTIVIADWYAELYKEFRIRT